MSIPTLSEFNPTLIPFQYEVLKDVRKNFDYSNGVYELLLSGSIGSAKSLLMSHIVVTHCLFNSGAVALIGRRALPQLKDTLLQMIIDHIGIDIDYNFNASRGQIIFPNGSKILCYSWADKNYKKVRSYALSMAAIEELTENDDSEFFKEIRMRLNRVQSVNEKLLICATNPDAPSHWAHEYFIEKQSETRKVYYSKTSDNPFLDQKYIEQLKETLSPKEARRMLYGEWIELLSDILYYNYDTDRNFKDDFYNPNMVYPIDITFDFNIGEGKPMSCAVGQYINEVFHCFDEIVIHGARTANIIEELINKGYIQQATAIRVFGDASGKNRDTRSIKSDYDIIKSLLNNSVRCKVEFFVPLANPPIRKRHNLVNSVFLNANGKVRFYHYKNTQTVGKGFRFTKLKKGGQYIEDDSDYFQHITTAIGYWVNRCIDLDKKGNAISFGRT